MYEGESRDPSCLTIGMSYSGSCGTLVRYLPVIAADTAGDTARFVDNREPSHRGVCEQNLQTRGLKIGDDVTLVPLSVQVMWACIK